MQMDNNPLIYAGELTWRKPKEIIPHWRENRKVLTRSADQDEEDECIPYALIKGMESKLRVQAFWNNERAPPKLSVQQLIDVRNNIKNPKHRTTNRLLDWIMKHGVVAAANYDARNHRADPYARRYKITGWEHVDVNDDLYIHKLKHLLTGSPVIAELPLYDSYDKTGQEQLLYRAEGEAIMDGGIQSGHAVLFTGWGYKPDTLFWEYQNSYGVRFGRDGDFGEIVHNKFHWVYAIKHVQVKDPSPNRASRRRG